MIFQICQLNLVLAWLGILCGFLTGLLLGLFFHREGWLGGYASFPRRLYRLGHVSLFGLGAVNLLFCFTAQSLIGRGALVTVASWAFVAGALSMPACCVVVAGFPRSRMLFAVPVLSLVLGGALTLIAVIQP